MKENNVHEGCIEQIERLFKEKKLLADTVTDEHGWVRMDDLELRDDIQDEVKKRWEEIDFDDRRQVADSLISQIRATGECVAIEWKI